MAFAGGWGEEAYTTPILTDVPADKGQTTPNQNDKAKKRQSGYFPGTRSRPATSHLPSPTGSLWQSLEASEVVAGEGGNTVTGQVQAQAKPDVQDPSGQSPATKSDSIQNVSSKG